MILLALAACGIDDSSFGSGGEDGDPTGLAGAGDNGGSGDDSASTDTGTTGCTADDLVWSTSAQNQTGTKPFYAGDTITLWGQVANPCSDGAVLLDLSSTCLFESITLAPPNGAPTQQAFLPGCTDTTKSMSVDADDIDVQSYTWGALYVAGAYTFDMQATTADARVVSGAFTIE